MTSTPALPSIFFAEGWQTNGDQRATLEINWRNRTIEVRQQFDGDCRHIPQAVFFGHATRWYIQGDVTMLGIIDLLEDNAKLIGEIMDRYIPYVKLTKQAQFGGDGSQSLRALKYNLYQALCVPVA
jgi:hypothetical protein